MSAAPARQRTMPVLPRWATPARRIALVRRDRRPLPRGGEILGFMNTRDNLDMARRAIEWHREIGIERFFVLDNDSSDGTRDWLLAQPDIHVVDTAMSYRRGALGTAWFQAMLDRFGTGHWCAIFDDDEHLAWPGMEDVPLADFLAFHDAGGYEVFAAVMVDMYARGPIAEAGPRPGEPLLETFPWYDPGPYFEMRRSHGRRLPPVMVKGGPRARLFGGQERTAPMLTKLPLVRWRRGMRRLSAHAMNGGWRLAPTGVALLHYRLTADLVPRSQQYQEWQADWGGQATTYDEALKRDPDFSPWYEGSARWAGSDRLTADGLLPVGGDYAAWRRDRTGG